MFLNILFKIRRILKEKWIMEKNSNITLSSDLNNFLVENFYQLVVFQEHLKIWRIVLEIF